MKKHLLLTTCLFLAAASLHAVATNWIEAKTLNEKTYFLHESSPRIEIYDLSNKTWLQAITLSQIPTAFHIDAEYLFIAYGNTLYRYSHDGTNQTHVGNFNYPVKAVFTDGNLLFVFHNSVTVFNKETTAVVSTDGGQYGLTYMRAGISHAPEINTFFGRSTGVSPSDIGLLQYEDDGSITLIDDSPHHGDYASASQTWAFPDNTKVVDSSGNAYNSASLQHVASFATQVDDLTFYGNDIPIVLSDDRIVAFSKALLETGYTTISVPAQDIVAYGEEIAVFYPDSASANGMAVQFIAVDSLNPDEPGEPIDPEGLPFVPDDFFIDEDNTLYLLSKTTASLFRWDISNQQWLTTLPLLGEPEYITYSALNDTVYTVYYSGKIFQMDLAATSPQELPFANLSTQPTGLIAAGQFIIGGDFSGAWEAMISFGADGSQIDYEDWNYPLHAAVWSEVNHKIYHFRDGTSPNDLLSSAINLDGTFGTQMDSPYHSSSGIQYPIRVKPDGTIVILGSGRIYNATTLAQINTLPGSINDATWIDGELYTLEDDTIIHYELPTYAIGASTTLPGTGIRILTTPDDHLLAISSLSDGTPFFSVLDDTYDLLPPNEFPVPVLILEDLSASHVELSWQRVFGAENYLLERRIGNTGQWTQIHSANLLDDGIYTDNSVSLGNVYGYRLKVDNNGFESDYSPVVEVPLLAPGMVDDLDAAALSETEVQLTWTDVDGETGYRIERSLDGSAWNTAASVDAGEEAFTDRFLQPGTVYYYRIVAFNDIADASASSMEEVATPIDPPDTPVILSADAVGATRVVITWDDVDSETGYTVERAAPAGGAETWVALASLPAGSTSYTDNSAQPEQDYLYRIVAENLGGTTASENSSTISTPALMIPGALEQVSFTVSSSQATLEWSQAVDVDQILVYRRLSGESQWTLLDTLSGDATSYTDNQVEIGNTYEYALLAENSLGSSPLEVAVTLEIPPLQVLLEEDFEDGYTSQDFSVVAGGTIRDDGPSGIGSYLYFSGTTERYAQTAFLAFAESGKIRFDLRAGNEEIDGSMWNNSETGENVVLEAYDGEQWYTLETLITTFPEHSEWTRHEAILPNHLRGQALSIRWRQISFSQGSYDQWGLDNILISYEISQPPQPPELVISGSNDSQSLVVFWLPVEDAEFYLVERSADNQQWVDVATVYAPYYHFKEDGLNPDSGYYYRISAGNSVGISAPTKSLMASSLTVLEEWKAENFGSIENLGTTDNSYVHENGLSTLAMYALNIGNGRARLTFNPSQPAMGGLPMAEIDESSDTLKLQFLRRRNHGNLDISYIVYCSGALQGPWQPGGSITGIEVIDSQWEKVTWTDDVPIDHNNICRFARLIILPDN